MELSEEIKMCLNCKKYLCNDCLSNKNKQRKVYEYKGCEYNMKELSEIRGVSYGIMRHRLKYGLDFAMSKYRTKKEYDEAKAGEEQ